MQSVRVTLIFVYSFSNATPCNGLDEFDYRECNENDCPSWTEWSPWGDCSTTCGGGTCTRQRKCKLPNGSIVPGNQCDDGSETETKSCNENRCPGKYQLRRYSGPNLDSPL